MTWIHFKWEYPLKYEASLSIYRFLCLSRPFKVLWNDGVPRKSQIEMYKSQSSDKAISVQSKISWLPTQLVCRDAGIIIWATCQLQQYHKLAANCFNLSPVISAKCANMLNLLEKRANLAVRTQEAPPADLAMREEVLR